MTFVDQICRFMIAALGIGLMSGCGESWSSAAGERSPVGVGPAPSVQGGAANSAENDPSRTSSEAAPTTDTASIDAPSAAAPPADATSDESPAGPTAGASDENAAASSAAPPLKSALATRIADISFDDIKFDMEKGAAFERSMLTPKIEALDGRKIRIRGFIQPTFVTSGLKQFIFVRDNLSCCFGPGAALYDAIVVEMIDDKSADYTTSPVTVEGVFSVRELRDPDDNIMAVYHLDGESVR